jgi:MFS family permease
MFYSNIFVVTSSLILIIFIKNKPPTPPSLAANTKKESYLKSFKICLSNKDFILLTFFFGLSIGSISTLATIVQQVLQPFNYKSDESGLIGALLILSGMIGSGFYGFMHDKYQNYKLLLIVGNVVQLFSWGFFIVFLYFQ